MLDYDYDCLLSPGLVDPAPSHSSVESPRVASKNDRSPRDLLLGLGVRGREGEPLPLLSSPRKDEEDEEDEEEALTRVSVCLASAT